MMKRKLTLCLALALLLLSGCGAGSSGNTSGGSTASAAQEAPMAAAQSADMGWSGGYNGGGDYFAAAEPASQSDGRSVYRDANAKLIREANLSVQTEEFDQAVAALDTLVESMGGYFQEASVYGGSYRDVNANRNGSYIIRVPAEKYQDFLGQAGELGYVTYKSETTEDIGEQYYDTEARLKTQQTKRERLLDLLARAESMEDIISLESALSEVEYQIEQYSSTLNRYDSLVGYATIYLDLQEVQRVTAETGTTSTLWQRMGTGFARSWRGFIEGGQDLLVWLSYNLLGLCVFAAFVCACVAVGRGVYRGRKKKHSQNPNNGEEH